MEVLGELKILSFSLLFGGPMIDGDILQSNLLVLHGKQSFMTGGTCKRSFNKSALRGLQGKQVKLYADGLIYFDTQ